MTGRLHSRGGTTASLAEGQELIERNRKHEARAVRTRILVTAHRQGEVHADDLADMELSSANVIGAQVNALANQGLLEKRNRHGVPEHRKAQARASHGRASYVWRLTQKGRELAALQDFLEG